MGEYKPKLRRKGINPPFGYFPSSDDSNIMLPDEQKLNALEHSFRMRAKFNTPLRDCCMWLQANTGDKMSPAGYMYAYKHWLKKRKQEQGKKMGIYAQAIRKAKELELERVYGEFTVKLDDDAVYPLAFNQKAEEV